MEVSSVAKWFQQVTQKKLICNFRSIMYKTLVALTTSQLKEVFL